MIRKTDHPRPGRCRARPGGGPRPARDGHRRVGARPRAGGRRRGAASQRWLRARRGGARLERCSGRHPPAPGSAHDGLMRAPVVRRVGGRRHAVAPVLALRDPARSSDRPGAPPAARFAPSPGRAAPDAPGRLVEPRGASRSPRSGLRARASMPARRRSAGDSGPRFAPRARIFPRNFHPNSHHTFNFEGWRRRRNSRMDRAAEPAPVLSGPAAAGAARRRPAAPWGGCRSKCKCERYRE